MERTVGTLIAKPMNNRINAVIWIAGLNVTPFTSPWPICDSSTMSNVFVFFPAEVEHQDGDQHQHAADERVQEELDRGVFLPRPSPDADQEVHRQQHHFPEHVKQEEIESQKDTQHSRLENQKQDEVSLHLLGDTPGGHHGQHRNEARQQHQRQADAVVSELVIDVPIRDPRLDAVRRRCLPVASAGRLNSRIVITEIPEQKDRQDERGDGDPEREYAHQLFVALLNPNASRARRSSARR